jgi:archaellum component FlaC
MASQLLGMLNVLDVRVAKLETTLAQAIANVANLNLPMENATFQTRVLPALQLYVHDFSSQLAIIKTKKPADGPQIIVKINELEGRLHTLNNELRRFNVLTNGAVAHADVVADALAVDLIKVLSEIKAELSGVGNVQQATQQLTQQVSGLTRRLEAQLNIVRGLDSKLSLAQERAKKDFTEALNEEQKEILETSGALNKLRSLQATIVNFMQLVLAFTSEVYAATELVQRMAGGQTNELRDEIPKLERMEPHLVSKENTLAMEASVISKDLTAIEKQIKDITEKKAEKLAESGINDMNNSVSMVNVVIKELSGIKADIVKANSMLLEEAQRARSRMKQ